MVRLKFVKRIYIIVVMAVCSVMLTSAMGIMPYSSHNEFTQPQDSIKLQSPLPKETGNAFDDANNSSKGIRLEDSPNSGYQIEYNPETDD